MKKTLCWLIVMAMLVAMAPSVFATEDAGDVQTVTLAQETVQVPASWWGIGFEYEVPADGTATIVIGEDHPEGTCVEYGYRSNEENGNYFKTYKDTYTQTINVTAGETIQVDLCLIIMNEDGSEGAYTGGQASFTLTFTGVLPEGWEGGAGGDDEEETGNTLVVGDNTLTIASGEFDSAEYSFAATEAGTLNLSVVSAVASAVGGDVDWAEDLESIPVVMYVNGESVDGISASVEVAAGDVVTVMLTQGRMYVNGGYSWEIGLNLAFEAGEGGEEEEPAGNNMALGNNVLESGGYVNGEYVLVAPETGTLHITIRNWTCNSIEYKEDMLTYGWSKLLINDVQATSMTSTLEVTAGDVITFVLTSDSDNYVTNVYLSMEGFFEEPLGSEFNPVLLTPADLPITSIEIPAGGTVWYELEGFNEYELLVYGEDAYIVSYYYDYSTPWPHPLVPTYHYAEDGVATYDVMYSRVMIGNAGTEAATFEIDGHLPLGLWNNPAELVMGEQSFDVAFEQYAYYITWTAPEAGTLTLVFSGDLWRYTVCNIGDVDDWWDDGEYISGRQLSGDSDTVTLTVEAGDVVEINVGCSDENWDIPAGTITINASFEAGAGEEPEEPVVLGALELGDNVIELPRGATVASAYTFVAPETGTLYFAAVDFQYSASWTDGYEDNNDYMSDWTMYTIFSVNGEVMPYGFYGSVDVVAGETYTFTWEHGEYSNYGYLATINLSYSDELLPIAGIDFAMTPADLPMSTIEIPAGGQQLYRIDYNFSGYILQIYGENVYLYYEYYDWWGGGDVSGTIYPENGVIEYSIDELGCQEFYICNTGDEAMSFQMDYYAPEGGEHNPYVVEELEDIYVSAVAQEEFYIYFQWTSDMLGTITVIPERVNISFYNVTKDESGEWGSDWISYSVYVEPGDVLQILVNGYPEQDVEFYFTYDFVEGYRLGSEQNPFEVDLMAGLSVDIYNETLYYSWTPSESMTVTLGFAFLYEWSTNLPTITINGEEYTLGDELTVTAGEPLVFALTTINSVYGTLQATKVGGAEPTLLGDVNGDGAINYLDAMLIAQYYVGDITEEGLDVSAADVNGDGVVNYLDAMLVAQFYVGDIESFEP